jgi:hypothetical protein
VELEQADGHHGEVGQLSEFTGTCECLDHFSHVGVGLMQDLSVLPLSFIAQCQVSSKAVI